VRDCEGADCQSSYESSLMKSPAGDITVASPFTFGHSHVKQLIVWPHRGLTGDKQNGSRRANGGSGASRHLHARLTTGVVSNQR